MGLSPELIMARWWRTEVRGIRTPHRGTGMRAVGHSVTTERWSQAWPLDYIAQSRPSVSRYWGSWRSPLRRQQTTTRETYFEILELSSVCVFGQENAWPLG